jgi:hypothetical protein
MARHLPWKRLDEDSAVAESSRRSRTSSPKTKTEQTTPRSTKKPRSSLKQRQGDIPMTAGRLEAGCYSRVPLLDEHHQISIFPAATRINMPSVHLGGLRGLLVRSMAALDPSLALGPLIGPLHDVLASPCKTGPPEADSVDSIALQALRRLRSLIRAFPFHRAPPTGPLGRP